MCPRRRRWRPREGEATQARARPTRRRSSTALFLGARWARREGDPRGPRRRPHRGPNLRRRGRWEAREPLVRTAELLLTDLCQEDPAHFLFRETHWRGRRASARRRELRRARESRSRRRRAPTLAVPVPVPPVQRSIPRCPRRSGCPSSRCLGSPDCRRYGERRDALSGNRAAVTELRSRGAQLRLRLVAALLWPRRVCEMGPAEVPRRGHLGRGGVHPAAVRGRALRRVRCSAREGRRGRSRGRGTRGRSARTIRPRARPGAGQRRGRGEGVTPLRLRVAPHRGAQRRLRRERVGHRSERAARRRRGPETARPRLTSGSRSAARSFRSRPANLHAAEIRAPERGRSRKKASRKRPDASRTDI